MGSKYFLTYDFRIIYCSSVELRIDLKEFDLNTLRFIDFNGDISIIDRSFEISHSEMEYLVKNSLSSKFGYEPNKSEVDWLIRYENILKNNEKILDLSSLTFNYLILKLLTIGFSEDIAENFVHNYYNMDTKDIDIKTFISNINSLLDNKKLWISVDTYSVEINEIEFLINTFYKKIELKHKFSFNKIKESYFKICSKSILSINYEYNSKPSYFIKNPKSLNQQKKLLMEFYIERIEALMVKLINDEFYDYNIDYKFEMNLKNEMIKIANLYLDNLNKI